MGSLYDTKEFFNDIYLDKVRPLESLNALEKIMHDYHVEKLTCLCGHKVKEDKIIDQNNRAVSGNHSSLPCLWNGLTYYHCAKNKCDFFLCPTIHNIGI